MGGKFILVCCCLRLSNSYWPQLRNHLCILWGSRKNSCSMLVKKKLGSLGMSQLDASSAQVRAQRRPWRTAHASVGLGHRFEGAGCTELQNIFCGFQVVWIWVLCVQVCPTGLPRDSANDILEAEPVLTLTVQDLNQTLQNSEGSMGFELGTDPAPQVSRVWRSTWRVRWTWYTYNPYKSYSNPFIPITNILTKPP